MNKLVMIFALVVIVLNLAIAQKVDKIYTIQGSVFRGKIVEYRQDSLVKIKLHTGDIVSINNNDIKKVVQGGVRPYQFETKKVFYQLAIQTTVFDTKGYARADNDFSMGYGIGVTIGYQFNRGIGLGGRVGVENYRAHHGLVVVPIAVHARGYLLKRNVSPYYSVDLGYGIGLMTDQLIYSKAKGGMMFYPALGIRFGGRSGAFTIDFGIKSQDVELEYRKDVNGGWGAGEWLKKIDKIHYFRTAIRMGILF